MRLKKLYRSRLGYRLYLACIIIILVLSSAVRVIQYLFNRSLWADEAVLSLNIVNRSYSQLLQPLDYDQGAPVGFLFIEKLLTQIFGKNEYALRLFPLLGGLVALILFYYLARKYLQIWTIPVALTLMGFLSPLIYYSTEVKQYSTDVAIALASFLIAKRTEFKLRSVASVIILSISGAALIWFSHPAICVLLAVGFSQFFLKSKSVQINSNFTVYIVWILSFLSFYFLSLQTLSANQTLKTSWQSDGAFPDAIFDPIWVLDSLGKFFYEPLEFEGGLDGLAIASFLLGCVFFYRRKKTELFVVLSPILATLIAAYFHQFPFKGRVVLFLAPFFILLIAEGICGLIKSRNPISKWLGLVMIILLLLQPLQKAIPLFYTPNLRDEIKPVIEYVKQQEQAGDLLYVYQRGIYQFQFYASKYGYKERDYILGIDDLDEYDGKEVSEQERIRYEKDLDQLRGHERVWVLFSHSWSNEENEVIKSYLDRIGTQIDFFESNGSFVYLYNLSENQHN